MIPRNVAARIAGGKDHQRYKFGVVCKEIANLSGVFDFAFARALALRAIAGSGAIEALAAVAGAFARGALAGAAANVALYSVFVHAGTASTQRPILLSVTIPAE